MVPNDKLCGLYVKEKMNLLESQYAICEVLIVIVEFSGPRSNGSFHHILNQLVKLIFSL